MNDRPFRIAARLLVLIAALAALAFLPPVSAVSQSPQQGLDAVDAYVADKMDDLRIPGAAVGIVRGGEIVHLRGYGVAGADGRAVTPTTPFLVASLSKSVTALGVMQLVEEGRLDLDAPLQDYLPWFQVGGPQASGRITVRHLLNQTSGISELEGYQRNLQAHAPGALEASLRGLRQTDLHAEPGSAFEYSNTNYDLLGLLIQTISGQPYEDYIRSRVFAPLEMTHAYTSLDEARAAGLASGYYHFFGLSQVFDRRIPYSHSVLPSAGLFASAEDMSHYLIAHLSEGRYRDTSVLSAAGMAELHKPAAPIGEFSSYAMGWSVFPFEAAAPATGGVTPITLAHGGEWIGYQAIAVQVPQEELGVIVLVNKSDPARGQELSNLGWDITLLALGLPPGDFPGEGFTTRYGRWLLLGLVALLLLSAGWSLRRLRRLASGQEAGARLGIWMVLLALLDLAIAGWLLLIWLPQNADSLPLALRFAPDIGLLYLTIVLLTLGWGVLRSGLYLLYRARRRALVPQHELSAA